MNIKQIVNDVLKEASSTSRNSEYISPLLPGYREFEKHMNGPFTEYVTGWDDPLLDHDSLDGKMSYSKKTIKKREKRAEKIARFIKNNPDSFAWDGDAGVLNGLPGQNTDAKPIKNFDPKKTTVSLDGKPKKNTVKEATTDSGSKGSFVPPLQSGIRYFKKENMGPFTEPVSNFKSPDLEYDSYDGKMERTKKQRKKEEAKALVAYNKIKNNPYATFSDEDGNIINQTPGKGKTFVPIKEWVELDGIDLNEDLAVWFGKKKKPKGSNQPKGPWVNICRKVDGKHPPCGRSDTSKGAYPKCRAAGVAGKMSDSEKRSACQQKRNAEKKDTQTGKGQKPVMTSYKKKKTNEDMKRIVRLTENDLSRIVKKVLLEQSTPVLNCDWFIMDTNLIDGQVGELQISQIRQGVWSIQKNTPNSNASQINLSVPLKNQLQVSWDSSNRQIVLNGTQTLNGMISYNTLFNQNNNAADCKVLYEGQTNDGPRLYAGTLKLETSNEQPKLLNNQVRLQNGATITFSNDYFVGRKRRYGNETQADRGVVYGSIMLKGLSSFNDYQKKCPQR